MQIVFTDFGNIFKVKDPIVHEIINKDSKTVLHHCVIAINGSTHYGVVFLMAVHTVGLLARFIFFNTGPEYPVPVYFHIPYLAPTNFLAWLVNSINQYWGALLIFFVSSWCIACAFTYFFITVKMLQTILELIEDSNNKIATYGFDYWIECNADLLAMAKE